MCLGRAIDKLTFDKPNTSTFKCLRLAYEAGKTGGLMPTILNAANEISVELFLKNRINFLQIGDIVEECMIKFSNKNKVDKFFISNNYNRYTFDLNKICR